MRVLVIGYGNPLRSDDALGWRVAEALEPFAITKPETADIEIVTCQQLNPELAEPLSRADLAIFVDAAVPISTQQVAVAVRDLGSRNGDISSHDPGTIIECDLEPTCQAPQCFSHDLTPSTLLACAGELFGSCPRGKLFSVVGADFGMGENLSAPVAAVLPELVQRIEALLASCMGRTQRAGFTI
jgi:Ni,Fe-hydrogenase maturation factor